jgi:hypothetical protein
MELRETLTAIHELGKSFHDGTQTTDRNRKAHVAEAIAYLQLIAHAKQLGATPFEINSAYHGVYIYHEL